MPVYEVTFQCNYAVVLSAATEEEARIQATSTAINDIRHIMEVTVKEIPPDPVPTDARLG